MPPFIQFFIVIFLYFRVAPRWNYSFPYSFCSKFHYTFTVIALICYQVFHLKSLFNSSARWLSCTFQSDMSIFSDIPQASTATCIFVFSPILRPLCLGFQRSHHLSAYEISRMSYQS